MATTPKLPIPPIVWPRPTSGAVQPKTSGVPGPGASPATVQPLPTPQPLSRNAAAPPPVFWQHPAPGSLQRKSANVQRQGAPAEARPTPRREPAPPPVSWPGRVPGVLRQKTGEPERQAPQRGPRLAPVSRGALQRSPAPAALRPTLAFQGQTIQRAAESKSEDRDVIREFNDLMLVGPKANFMGSFKVEVPRMTGELVALSGVHGPGGAFLTASGKPSKAEMKMVDVYTAASGRPAASGKLRDNSEEAIRLWKGRMHRRDTSGLDTQAQHVVPFSELHSASVVKLFTANSEHPFNSQLLPNKTQFRDELESLVPVWSASSSGIIKLPSKGVDYSELSGSFHQGYHSAYSKGTWAMMVEVMDDLASWNGGKWTAEMMEAAIFHAQKGARGYGSGLYPLYRHFEKGSAPIFVFPHFSVSDVSDLTDVAMADASDQNEVLSDFVKKKVLELGKY